MSVRVILSPEVPRKIAEKKAFALHLDTLKIIQASEEHPFEIIYSSSDEKTLVHLIDDALLDTRYFHIEEPNAAKWATKIRHELETIDEKAIATLLGSTKTTEVKQGIGAAALLAPAKFNKRFFAFFEKGLAHRSADVRDHTILAIGYLGWPQFVEPLQELAENDPSKNVRESARSMLDGFEMQKRGELE